MSNPIAISRDASLGVEVLEVTDPIPLHNRISTASVRIQIRLEPLGETVWIQLLASQDWLKSYEPTWLGLGLPAGEVINGLAPIVVGELLDRQGVPELPVDKDHFAGTILLSEVLQGIEERRAGSDDEILVYLAGLLYWGYRFRQESTTVSSADHFRLRTTLDDFHHVTRRYDGEYWTLLTMGGRYEPTNRLLAEVSSGVFPGFENRPVFQVQRSLASSRYSAASHHFAKSIEKLRQEPSDVETAAKEAVNALESLAKVMLDRPNATLGECTIEFRKRGMLRPPLHKILDAISGFRGATPGVGHGGTELPDVTPDEARFVINVTGAGILFLMDLDRLQS